MALGAGDGFEGLLVPGDFFGDLVETQEMSLVRLFLSIRINVAVKAHLQVGFAAGFGGSREVKVVLPDDGAGVAETGDRRLPTDVLTCGDIPGHGGRALGDAAGARAAELRPVHCGRCRGGVANQRAHPWNRSEERRVGKECRSRWSPY